MRTRIRGKLLNRDASARGSEATHLALAFIALMPMSLAPSAVKAAWIDVTGTVQSITSYAHTDTVLVQLSTAGSAGACANSTVFAVDEVLPADRRKKLMAVLLSAQARGSSITLTFDNASGCVSWDGVPNVYRGIVRLTVPE